RGGERHAQECAGIEIEPHGKMLLQAGLERRVAMNNREAVVARVGEEWLANPQQLIPVLQFERNTRANACVDEETLVVTDTRRQVLKPGKMLVRNRIHARNLVAAQRHIAAIAKPKRLVAIAEGADQQILVVAAQTGDLSRL